MKALMNTIVTLLALFYARGVEVAGAGMLPHTGESGSRWLIIAAVILVIVGIALVVVPRLRK
ncbi:hypothetical protein CL176_01055 [Suicoccus acidiformans]|uniref:Gram-positive cocci surface proteins LPxTG domain-containing protein n=1 Tax=Suicoccus acidiformans TaxID=2036206 RepID=A0A347WI21_9LACT|nr:LPXTG cell wall anchor domain-containing protein [Suicoccus acidiformans]AXY24728.1 hypothetical protein CL176_01055 [Suicoccus acidiformans]